MQVLCLGTVLPVPVPEKPFARVRRNLVRLALPPWPWVLPSYCAPGTETQWESPRETRVRGLGGTWVPVCIPSMSVRHEHDELQTDNMCEFVKPTFEFVSYEVLSQRLMKPPAFSWGTWDLQGFQMTGMCHPSVPWTKHQGPGVGRLAPSKR